MACCCCGTDDGSRRKFLRQSTIRQEDMFKQEMEQLFSTHGNEGIPLCDLGAELEGTELVKVIPKKKLQTLLRKADADENSYITYAEFMDMYFTSSQLTKSEKSAMRKFVGAAVHNIIPKYLREDFLRNYNCRPPPIFMIAISIAEICTFVYFAVEISRSGSSVTAMAGLPKNDPFTYKPHRRYEAWRFLSYMLIHDGYVHLIINLLFQLFLGLPLEMVHKWWRLLIVYTAGVIGGSLAHSVTDYNVSLVGASGGCYALIGAHLASVILNWKEMNYKCAGCADPVRVVTSAWMRVTVLILIVSADTGSAVYRRFFEPDGGKVGISAHIGGLLTGLLLGVPAMKNVNIEAWEKKFGWVTLSIFVAAMIFCIIFNGLYQNYPKTDWSPCC